MKLKLFFAFTLFCSSGFSQTQDQNVWEHARSTVSDTFDKTGLIILGAGTLATLVAFNQDQVTQSAWIDNQRMAESTADIGDFWGTGIPAVTMALGQLVFDTDNGIASSEGLLASTLLTYGLKFSTKRPRPGTGTQTSFPSGHSQISFASATTLLMSYGWVAATPAYLMAGLTGLSRMADNAHWLSDVVAGATIGILFGRGGFKHHFTIAPLTLDDGGHGAGLIASWRF
jgi:hypothetical protein